jgi:hypothetical protein
MFNSCQMDGDKIVVRMPPTATDPRVVLFAWDCIAVHNLMNKEGLPAVCFLPELDAEVRERLRLHDEAD